MILATFDPSGRTGVAWGSVDSGAPSATTYRLPDDSHSHALSVLRQSAVGLFRHYGVTHVCVEAPLLKINRQCSAASLYFQVSVTAVILEAAASCTIPDSRIELVPVERWRKSFLGGNGRFSTEDAKAGALARCRLLGWPVVDHNSAEAAGMWFWKMATTNPRWRPTRLAA